MWILSLLGLVLMVFIAWLLSNNRKAFPWRPVVSGILLQFCLGVLILKTEWGVLFFGAARDFFARVIGFSDLGAEMVFGESFREHFYAFSVTATIIFASASLGVLFHLGLIQKLVKAVAWLMVRVMKTSGSESLAASANIFMGQTEAPLVVRPYIKKMTGSELNSLMIGGMATASGGTLAAYVSFGVDAGHVLSASLMSAPAALLIAKVMYPEVEESTTMGVVKIELPKEAENVLDAACRGAADGLKLALNVAAMLIAFIALAALLNFFLSWLPSVFGEPLTFERILGWIFYPMAWLMGVASADVHTVSQLLGKKMFLNEFLAYLQMVEVKDQLDPRSLIIATYALCGFANFSSIAIQIGGLGALVPERRSDFAKFGLKAMIGGTLACNMTACIAGILIH